MLQLSHQASLTLRSRFEKLKEIWKLSKQKSRANRHACILSRAYMWVEQSIRHCGVVRRANLLICCNHISWKSSRRHGHVRFVHIYRLLELTGRHRNLESNSRVWSSMVLMSSLEHPIGIRVDRWTPKLKSSSLNGHAWYRGGEACRL
jgi:hypothetical protein